jgi:hypothetical protein
VAHACCLAGLFKEKGADFMLRLKRVHDTGTQVLLRQCEDGWRMNIDLREPNHNPMKITGYLVPTERHNLRTPGPSALREHQRWVGIVC